MKNSQVHITLLLWRALLLPRNVFQSWSTWWWKVHVNKSKFSEPSTSVNLASGLLSLHVYAQLYILNWEKGHKAKGREAHAVAQRKLPWCPVPSSCGLLLVRHCKRRGRSGESGKRDRESVHKGELPKISWPLREISSSDEGGGERGVREQRAAIRADKEPYLRTEEDMRT